MDKIASILSTFKTKGILTGNSVHENAAENYVDLSILDDATENAVDLSIHENNQRSTANICE